MFIFFSFSPPKSSECSQRLVLCQYCDLEIVYRQSKEHEDYCGARTEPCLQCKANVMLKEKDVHAFLCGSLTPPEERNNSRAKFSPRDQQPVGAWFDAYSVRNSLQTQERGPKNNNVSTSELHSPTRASNPRVNNTSWRPPDSSGWKSSGSKNSSHNHCELSVALFPFTRDVAGAGKRMLPILHVVNTSFINVFIVLYMYIYTVYIHTCAYICRCVCIYVLYSF